MVDNLTKKLSCGIVFVNSKSQVLMLHPMDQRHWDIPKGTKNTEETESEAAIRETREETGIVVDPSALLDLSWFEYNKYKDLWLFITKMPDIELDQLYCTSFFTNEDGKEGPEADSFELVDLSEFEERACYSMQRIFRDGGLKRDIEDFVADNFKSSSNHE
ncbi:NUDIX hydrolase [Psychromonas sp. SP041]|uniref:NUDIX hydrolase n=1 Tax=Psychromonas sp. SP041 TaxID=1365007 RepID=UPI00046FE810|nr:NUDIX hydrolase [Psychromonas sp. SP041]